MKKVLIYALVFMIILSSSGVQAFAEKNYEAETQVIIDSSTNKQYEVPVVNLLMNGQDVFSDVSAMLFEGRTLVPVRIAEKLGAKVGWNQDTKEVTLTTSSKTIVLKIDSPKVWVNGVEKELPSGVPAKLVGVGGSYRTMVPIRFISEELNMEVGWIDNTKTVTIDKPKQSLTDIRFEGSSKFPEIVLKATGDISTNGFFLNGSDVGGEDKLIIDLPNVDVKLNNPAITKLKDYYEMNIYENDVKSIKVKRFTNAPLKTRLEIGVDRKKGFETTFDKAKNEVRIKLINTVKDVKVEDFYGVKTVVINTAETPTYNVIHLKDKIVIDVLDSLLKYDEKEILYNQGGINAVRLSQFTPDYNYAPDDKISRIVVDVTDNITQDNVYIEAIDNKIYVFVAGIPLDGIDYLQESLNQSSLAFSTINNNSYTKNYNSANKLLSIKVNKDNLSLSNLNFDVDDDIVEYINVDESDANFYKIDVKLAKGTAYKETTNDMEKKIQFMFVNNTISTKQYNGKLIVIDPGHGGHDSGANSPRLKLMEKTVVLDVSLKLKSLLESRGFKVYITRADDTFVNLYDRAGIANDLKADLFISVHANAHSNLKASGVEVLYYPTTNRDNEKLSRVLQNALVTGLNAVDRGIVKRPKLVVTRETNMTAALVEIGFLTHSTEEQLLSTKEYRNKVAKVLLQGVMNYYDGK